MSPKAKMLTIMTKPTPEKLSSDFARAANLMAHPFAGAAAMSALGVGIASQAVGFWFGAMTGAAAASRRMFVPLAPATKGDQSVRDAPQSPAVDHEVPALTPVSRAATGELPAKIRKLTPKVRRVVVAPAIPEAAPPALQLVTPSVDADQTTDRVPEVSPFPMDEGVSASAPVGMDARVADISDVAADVPDPLVIGAATWRQPTTMDRPAVPDDLKAISGIGPKLEQVLNGLGIWTFAQIARWSAAEIGWVDDRLGFGGRVGRDDWVGQAAARMQSNETANTAGGE